MHKYLHALKPDGQPTWVLNIVILHLRSVWTKVTWRGVGVRDKKMCESMYA